jgi:hypothetical protein
LGLGRAPSWDHFQKDGLGVNFTAQFATLSKTTNSDTSQSRPSDPHSSKPSRRYIPKARAACEKFKSQTRPALFPNSERERADSKKARKIRAVPTTESEINHFQLPIYSRSLSLAADPQCPVKRRASMFRFSFVAGTQIISNTHLTLRVRFLFLFSFHCLIILRIWNYTFVKCN